MKKNLLLSFALIFIFTLGIVSGYRYFATNSDLSGDQNQHLISILESNDCLVCHSTTGKVPFYAVGPMEAQIKEDMRIGYRFIDFQVVVDQLKNGENVSEIDVIKLRQSLLGNSMPLLKYKAINWSSNLNKKEKQAMANWIRNTRNTLYPNHLADAKFVSEPLKPLRNSIEVDEIKVELGFDLFHDVRLSANNTISCATCHELTTGGVDLLQTSKGIHDQIGGINAPTVYNSALNMSQFWDGRAKDLQEQAGGPPLDMLEMGSNWEQITSKLKSDKKMDNRFKKLYGKEGITQNTITDAIAEFEKTLLTPDAKFDNYLKGDLTAITAEELDGYNLFKNNDCATCHAGENIGGNSYDYMGVAKDYFADRGTELHAKDMGRIGVTSAEIDKHRFKTPTLRNIALTPPYFHDGTIESLPEAVKLMARYQIGNEMSESDVQKITLFLNTLTGKNPYMVKENSTEL